MGNAASRPPVLGEFAREMRKHLDSLVDHGGPRLVDAEDRDNERELLLAKAALLRFFELHCKARVKVIVALAQEAGATGEQVAFTLGLRPQTVAKQFPRPRGHAAGSSAGFAGWRKQP